LPGVKRPLLGFFEKKFQNSEKKTRNRQTEEVAKKSGGLQLTPRKTVKGWGQK